MPTVARKVLSVIAPLGLCCLLGFETVPTSSSLAGAAVAATTPAPCISATTTPVDLPGDSAVSVAETCQSSDDDIAGGEQLPPASFAKPTRRGDLLVAAVLCGVLNGGMVVPKLTSPSGWEKAKKHTGGIDGGLEVAIFYQADNPGGTTSVTLGQVPKGNDDVSCTTFTWEITGTGDSSAVDKTGFASVDGGTSINVATSEATRDGDDLVLVAETDGSEYPPNQYQVSHHFEMVSVWGNGQEYQPGTFSALVADDARVQRTTVSQASAQWLDSAAVIVALTM